MNVEPTTRTDKQHAAEALRHIRVALDRINKAGGALKDPETVGLLSTPYMLDDARDKLDAAVADLLGELSVMAEAVQP